MGLGVLESKLMRDVPGHVVQNNDASQLKRTKDGIVLVPQPSDDPRDPLNWPLWRRDMITFLLCMLSVLASTLSPLLAANTITLLFWFQGQTITSMALLTGYHLLGVAVAGFFFVASARVWGKRHTYILGTVIIIASSIWGGYAGHSYESLVAARFFQGVGLAPFEACVNASVGDLYCVHERGKRMALTNLCLFGGAFFTPVIVGVITETMGWWWTFWFIAIFASIFLPVVFVLCPETTFIRDQKRHIPTPTIPEIYEFRQPSSAASDDDRKFSDAVWAMNKRDSHIMRIETMKEVSMDLGRDHLEAQRPMQPVPWVSKTSLKLFNGRFTDESFFQLLLRPLPLFFHPGILWACLIQGTLIMWTALLGVILAVVVIAPPLSFNATQTGFMYGGAFVGALVGFILSGVLADSSTKWLCKMNNGVFEPEFRMVLVIPQMFFGCIGLFGFGYASANTAVYGWVLPDVFFGFVTCGMVLGAVASALYIVDAHADIEVEGFTCLLIFKNMLTFVITFYAFDWYSQSGIYKLMYSSGAVQVGILSLTIPMYIFGKKNRAFFTKYDMLKILWLR
ncbi:hypothetical protein AMS68_000968 [Peltaster fructicola]|uniref:Major facilitator superfamily (MFS) profile domain-containing protein n=1 Tax=Peltaster fructicola TaxID=286661 RepID=A0A6H0XLD6_9PEZI|nr:hypothetical protein AMS68_000968 [Peltaster fructicola]